MEDDDLACVCFAHTHVMDFADEVDVGCNFIERLANGRGPLGWSIAAGLPLRLHRLDMSLNLNGRP